MDFFLSFLVTLYTTSIILLLLHCNDGNWVTEFQYAVNNAKIIYLT